MGNNRLEQPAGILHKLATINYFISNPIKRTEHSWTDNSLMLGCLFRSITLFCCELSWTYISWRPRILCWCKTVTSETRKTKQMSNMFTHVFWWRAIWRHWRFDVFANFEGNHEKQTRKDCFSSFGIKFSGVILKDTKWSLPLWISKINRRTVSMHGCFLAFLLQPTPL